MSACLAQTLYQHLAAFADRITLVVDDVQLTGHECLAQVTARQYQLRACHICSGDRVIVKTGRGVLTWIDALALWGLGAVPILCEATIDHAMAQHIAIRAQPHDTVCDTLELAQPGSSSPLVEPIVASEPGLILLTSGSTGLPKAVVLTRDALLRNAQSSAAVIGLNTHTALFAPVPFRFVSAVSHFLVALLSGVQYVGTETRLMQADLIERVNQIGATAFGGSPLQARWLADAGDTLSSAVSFVMASGDHLPVAPIKQLLAGNPDRRVITAYGLTEVAGRCCILHPDKLPAFAGSVGVPISGLSVRVANETGRTCAVNETGEVCVGGGHGFTGYLNEPDINRQVLRNGEFYTGDLGYQDDKGLLWLTGRCDDVFKSAGIKVSTQPIVDALMALKLFDDVAVAPHPDAQLGAVPHVFYCLAPDKEFVRGDVMRALRQTLKSGQLPRHFSAVKAIPRTPSGKVRRADLRQWIYNGPGHAG